MWCAQLTNVCTFNSSVKKQGVKSGYICHTVTYVSMFLILVSTHVTCDASKCEHWQLMSLLSPSLSPLGQWTPVTTSPIGASHSKVYWKENFRFSQFHCYVQIYFYDRWTPVFSGKKIQWGQWKAQPQMCKLTDQGCIKKVTVKAHSLDFSQGGTPTKCCLLPGKSAQLWVSVRGEKHCAAPAVEHSACFSMHTAQQFTLDLTLSFCVNKVNIN